MIEIEDLSVFYDPTGPPVLDHVNLWIGEAELVAVAGRTGSGKSSLLGTFNGLVPRFSGGHLDGDVRVAGVSIRDQPPRAFAHLVGMVGQDPLSGFVADTVEDELAYGMEQLGVDVSVMRRRIEETLDLLGIAALRRRPLRTLSGGQQQRVAIGAVLTMHPPVLVLDEPTSALDPTAAEEVLATLARLVSDLGVTVILAEHRLERVLPFADRLVVLDGAGHLIAGPPREVLEHSPVRPPIIELAAVAGWSPPPLTVRDARRLAGELSKTLSEIEPDDLGPIEEDRPVLMCARHITVRYGSTVAVRNVDLEVRSGEIIAIMGRNGSGKSSLLWALVGSGPRHRGHVDLQGTDPADLDPAHQRRLIGLVPQTPSDLLYLETVREECAAADADAGATPGTCQAIMDDIVPGVDPESHPRDLSEGQRLALVVAIQLSAHPRVLLLDEPTRGLDYPAKAIFAEHVRELARSGHAVIVATHDVELVAVLAHRVVLMAQGEIVSDAPANDALFDSPAFSPQVAKILGRPWTNVERVTTALESRVAP